MSRFLHYSILSESLVIQHTPTGIKKKKKYYLQLGDCVTIKSTIPQHYLHWFEHVIKMLARPSALHETSWPNYSIGFGQQVGKSKRKRKKSSRLSMRMWTRWTGLTVATDSRVEAEKDEKWQEKWHRWNSLKAALTTTIAPQIALHSHQKAYY